MIGCDEVEDDDVPYGVRREGSRRLPLPPLIVPKKMVSRTRMRSLLPPLRLPASAASSGATLLQSRTWSPSWWLCSITIGIGPFAAWLADGWMSLSRRQNEKKIRGSLARPATREPRHAHFRHFAVQLLAPPQCNAVGDTTKPSCNLPCPCLISIDREQEQSRDQKPTLGPPFISQVAATACYRRGTNTNLHVFHIAKPAQPNHHQ